MKLSLRDALWLITLIALAIGWAVERHRRMQAHSQTVEKLSREFQATKSKLAEAEDIIVQRSKQAARATDDFVRENPWQSVGAAAGIGLVIGLLIGRR